jgi:hypothetical protein
LFDKISPFISPEMRKTQSINRKLDEALKCKKKELDRQAKELEESKAHNDLERRSFLNDIEKVSTVVNRHLNISLKTSILQEY